MPFSLPKIRSLNAEIARAFKQPPVAVFVGGTAGIGEGMVRTLAQHTNGNSNIIIVGRNKEAADEILASLPPAPAGVKREFIQCDATLMKNISATTKEILSRYSKINYLVMTTGIMTLGGRDETTEGIDKKLAVHYYTRWKFLSDLLPALESAKEAGEEAKVVNVHAAGKGGSIDLDDLDLKKNYSSPRSALTTPTYNDLMMESFAEKSPKITFIHAYPGIVRTTLMSKSDSWLLRSTSSLTMALARPFSVSREECGEYMWHAALSTANAPGAWRTGSLGEDLAKKNYYGDAEQRKALWDHTVQTVEAALEK
ncbi:NAD(P)-binding protein [Agrocybe pediades]|nr:NAD(P)-binding protein [Agrocybe pediades]